MRNQLQRLYDQLLSRLQPRQNDSGQDSQIPLPPPPPLDSSAPQRVIIEISPFSVFKAVLVVVAVLWMSTILTELTSLIVMLLMALFLSAVISPAVRFFERLRIPRGVGIILVLVLALTSVSLIFGSLIPVIADQIVQIVSQITQWADSLLEAQQSDQNSFLLTTLEPLIASLQVDQESLLTALQENARSIANNLTQFANAGVSVLIGTITALANIFFVLILTFFLTLERGSIGEFFSSLWPRQYREYIDAHLGQMQNQVAEWMKGQALLFILMASTAFVGLSLIGVPNALTLSLVAGFGEFLPYIGPILTFALAAPVAFGVDMSTGVSTMVFFIALQMLEGNVYVPMVMRQTVGLSPVATIIALIIGASFPQIINPILGMLISVPVALMLRIFIRDLQIFQRSRTTSTEDAPLTPPSS